MQTSELKDQKKLLIFLFGWGFPEKKRQVAHCLSDMTEFACSAAHEPQSSINQIFDFTQEVITALKCYCITKNTMQASRHQDPS